MSFLLRQSNRLSKLGWKTHTALVLTPRSTFSNLFCASRFHSAMSSGAATSEVLKTAVVWHKLTDLRLDDNDAVVEAHRSAHHVLHVFVFDTDRKSGVFGGGSQYGAQRCGPNRLSWIVEAVEDLRARLRQRNSDLIVREGDPAEVISDIVKMFNQSGGHRVSNVFAHDELCHEEKQLLTRVKNSLPCKLKLIWGGENVLHVDDLPAGWPEALPDVCAQFRQKIERMGLREKACERYVPVPNTLQPLPPLARALETGDIPQIPEASRHDARSAIPFKAGETAALCRLEDYFWNLSLPRSYKDTRNEMLGPDFSTKFSLWLATGSLSPRRILKELSKYENRIESNKSTYWIWFELAFREFFRFQAIKQGVKMFTVEGPRNVDKPWNHNNHHLNAWKEGRTGYPLVDANMIEMNLTGFMSNRGRQIVASFLTKDLQVDWRYGAAFFEEKLVDYDCAANWGNWAYGAGVGCDPREDRYFSIPKQGANYDPDAAYIKTWLPQLAGVSSTALHQGRIVGTAAESYTSPPIVKLKFGSASGGGYNGRGYGKGRGGNGVSGQNGQKARKLGQPNGQRSNSRRKNKVQGGW